MFPILIILLLAGAAQEAMWTAPASAHVGQLIPLDRPAWQSSDSD